MGTGMAFPWAMAVTMPLANANIVEDMKMGIELALAGTPPMFCPEALVTSEFPVVDAAVKSQRTRWEHGHLSMILREVPRLLGRALIRLDMQALGLALDLLVPPLALLVLMQFGMLILAGLAAMFGAGFMPLLFATFGVALLFAVVLLAWLGWGRQVVSLGDLLSVPVYVLAKIPLYFRFWTHRQREWIRTDRK
jgi:cellulose synthase/poly-beta-1,6-N-acetylglucosamine synthase-like glycosyltransferase